MKILLIKPAWFVPGGVYRHLDSIRFTPLPLALLAALSPEHEVTIIDNDWDEIPYNDGFDLVGITVTTFTSERAYAIAERFRSRGITVVMGGVHASLMPGECLEHADSVVIGEAEYVWPQLLRDVERGSPKKKYSDPRPVDMNDVPLFCPQLFRNDPWIAAVQATRGCTNSCRFCYLPHVSWHAYRKRSIDLVYEDLESVKQKILFFVDDNMFADHEYAIRLCERIAPLNKVWSVQAPADIVENRSLLKAMKKAGCFHVHIGFQTVNPDSLKSANVMQNRISRYGSVVRRLHRYGMFVVGFFVFGFDNDDERVFRVTEKAIKEMDLDDAYFYVLTPYPGTDMYRQFSEEGRILPGSRTRYGWANAVYEPKLMSASVLEKGVQGMYERLRPHFRRKAPLKLLKRLPLFVRHPHLITLAAKLLIQGVDISKGPPSSP